MIYKKPEQGFVGIVLIIALVVVVVLAGVGYLIVKKQMPEVTQPTPTVETSPPPTSTPKIAEQAFSCGDSVVKDIDGNEYKTVKIGEQCWLKENLKVTKNPQGKAITRYCYDNDPKICETDGGLYDWNTTMNGSTQEGSQGICPNGWHVPKDSGWYILEKGLATGSCDANRGVDEGCESVGTKLKSGGVSGFEAIIAGVRMSRYGESFRYRGDITRFWSSTETSKSGAWTRDLISMASAIGRGPGDKIEGMSVRCLKD